MEIKITNSGEVNSYYKIINDIIDEYLIKWNIKPSQLKKYLKPGGDKFKFFLKKHNLENIKEIQKIIIDIIDDRVFLEKDKLLTFERFVNHNKI